VESFNLLENLQTQFWVHSVPEQLLRAVVHVNDTFIICPFVIDILFDMDSEPIHEILFADLFLSDESLRSWNVFDVEIEVAPEEMSANCDWFDECSVIRFHILDDPPGFAEVSQIDNLFIESHVRKSS
tara:strand:+ start:1302 stop:1685 length:384 start_codon:yes stop_codon:yes gene_type:complete